MTTEEKHPTYSAPRMLEMLREEVGPELVKEFGYTSVMEIPKLDKIVLNMGLGEALQNNRAIDSDTEDPVSYTHLTLPTKA